MSTSKRPPPYSPVRRSSIGDGPNDKDAFDYWSEEMSSRRRSLDGSIPWRQLSWVIVEVFLAETVGTAMLVFFGCAGVVAWSPDRPAVDSMQGPVVFAVVVSTIIQADLRAHKRRPPEPGRDDRVHGAGPRVAGDGAHLHMLRVLRRHARLRPAHPADSCGRVGAERVAVLHGAQRRPLRPASGRHGVLRHLLPDHGRVRVRGPAQRRQGRLHAAQVRVHHPRSVHRRGTVHGGQPEPGAHSGPGRVDQHVDQLLGVLAGPVPERVRDGALLPGVLQPAVAGGGRAAARGVEPGQGAQPTRPGPRRDEGHVIDTTR